MIDLYITYGLREACWVKKLTVILDSEGYTVCSDHAVVPGDDVRTEENLAALDTAKCVLAIWSDTSVDDFWVLSDADRAMEQSKLLSVLAKPAIIPERFSELSTVDMQDWHGGSEDDKLLPMLLKAIGALAKPSGVSQFERDQALQARQLRMKADKERRLQEALESKQSAKLRRSAV